MRAHSAVWSADLIARVPSIAGTLHHYLTLKGTKMHEILRHQDEAPGWLIGVLREIDTLQFGPAFERFLPDAELMFGAMHAKGVTAIRKLFVSLTGDLMTQHRVLEFWSGRYTNLFRGDVQMVKKIDASRTIVAPTVQFFIMGGRRLDRIATVRILVGPMGFDLRRD